MATQFYPLGHICQTADVVLVGGVSDADEALSKLTEEMAVDIGVGDASYTVPTGALDRSNHFIITHDTGR